jgi:Amt family ammonium transporter
LRVGAVARKIAAFLFLLLSSNLFGIVAPVFASQALVPQAQQIAALERQAADAKSSADNAWMLTSAALVLMMTGPGLALFYGGLVRKKMSSLPCCKASP